MKHINTYRSDKGNEHYQRVLKFDSADLNNSSYIVINLVNKNSEFDICQILSYQILDWEHVYYLTFKGYQ